MAIKKAFLSVEEVAARLNRNVQDVATVVAELGGQISEEDLSIVAKTLDFMANQHNESVQKAEKGQPGQSAIDPSNLLREAHERAMQASVQAAATMGDSTTNLFTEVESQLTQMRQQRDQQLAAQIASRIFEQENEALGKSFGATMGWIATFDPFKGTPLEGLKGSSSIDINKMLDGKKN